MLLLLCAILNTQLKLVFQGQINYYHKLDVSKRYSVCDELFLLQLRHDASQQFGGFGFARLAGITGCVLRVCYQHIHITTGRQSSSVKQQCVKYKKFGLQQYTFKIVFYKVFIPLQAKPKAFPPTIHLHYYRHCQKF